MQECGPVRRRAPIGCAARRTAGKLPDGGCAREERLKMNGENALAIDWQVPPDSLHIAKGEAHLWRADLHGAEDARDRLWQSLSADERARAERFVFERDRQRWAAGRGILREILALYLGRHPRALAIVNRPDGKPTLSNRCAGDPAIRFNLSHSESLAVLAVTLDQEVGVDVETYRPEVATAEIAERYFSSDEQSEFRSLPESLRTEGFFLCSTRKEGFLKASGEGLRTPLDSFTVSLTPGRPPTLRCQDAQRWHLSTFYPDSHSTAALVTEGSHLERRFWEWR